MTTNLGLNEIAERLKAQFGQVVFVEPEYLEVTAGALPKVAGYLKNTPGLDFDFLDMVTAADYAEQVELIYRLISLKNNNLVSLRVKCPRDHAEVPSVAELWHGARLQEREIYDLFGIGFSGHPDLRRIVLWEGYQGHPLRKDFKDRAYDAGN
jgi:NADH-quinone oxidoreductase subunit C